MRAHIETRLPYVGSRLEKIARTFSERTGVKVVFQRDTCQTDMKGTIILPSNVAELAEEDMDLVWAKLNHESEHVKTQLHAERLTKERVEPGGNKELYQLVRSQRASVNPTALSVESNEPFAWLNRTATTLEGTLWNAIEDVRIERVAGRRYKGVARSLAKGRDRAHEKWKELFERNHPRLDKIDPITRLGVAIIFKGFNMDYSFMDDTTLAAVRDLAPLLAYLSEDNMVTYVDSINLAVAVSDFIRNEEGDEDEDGDEDEEQQEGAGDDSDDSEEAEGGDEQAEGQGEGDEQSDGGTPAKGDGEEAESEGGAGDGDAEDDAEGDAEGQDGDGDGEGDDAAAQPEVKDQDHDSEAGQPTRGPVVEGENNAMRQGTMESPDMSPVTKAEMLDHLRRRQPMKLQESPLHEVVDEAILKAAKIAGHAVTNMAVANSRIEYTVDPAAAELDALVRVEPDQRKSERMRHETSNEANTLAARIRILLQTRSQKVTAYAQRHGKLDRRALYRVAAKLPHQGIPENIRTRVLPGQTHDVAIGLLGDCSGSMSGTKMYLAQQGITLLGDTLDIINRTTANDLQFAAWGFTCGYPPGRRYGGSYSRTSPVIHYQWKDWDESWVRERARVAGPIRSLDNADPDSVKWALDQVRSRPAKRHILMVLSDGQPAAGGNMEHLRRELKVAVASAVHAGMEVWGFGIMDSSVRHYYPNYRVCNNVQELSKAILEVAPYWFNLHRHR